MKWRVRLTLEAKLVLEDMVFSILTEFVENESVSKQDCEINATKRLMSKLKFKFRKLNICILGDSLYACCLDYQAIKNHYLLVQISDILRQLLENGSEVIKELKLGIKEISSRILESFRREPLTLEDMINIAKHTKIRYL